VERLSKEKLGYIKDCVRGGDLIDTTDVAQLISDIEALEHELVQNETVIGAFRISEKRLRERIRDLTNPLQILEPDWTSSVMVPGPDAYPCAGSQIRDSDRPDWPDTGDNFHV
jgi:hypothetical protein